MLIDRSLGTVVDMDRYTLDNGIERQVGEVGKLGVDQIDLLILHQAIPAEFDISREIEEA